MPRGRWTHRLLPWALAVAAVFSAGGCVTPSDLLTDRPCPCATGWRCDEAQSPPVCVEGSGVDSGVPDSAAPDSGPLDSGVGDSGPGDSSTEDSGSVDGSIDGGAGPPPPVSRACWRQSTECDWTADGYTFQEVLGTGEFTDYAAANAGFSPDGCSVYFNVWEGGDFRIWRRDRTAPGGDFSAPVLIDELDEAGTDADSPSIGPDGLEFFFTSNRGPSGTRRVHRSVRPAEDTAWGTPERIPTLDVPDSVGWEPRIAPHGLRLYYAQKITEQWVHVAERPALGAEFGLPVRVNLPDIPSGNSTNRPTVAHSDRLLVAVRQPADGTPVDRRAFYTTRTNWNATWGPVAPVPTAVGMDGMRDIAVSADGCELLVRDAIDHAALMLYTPR